MSFAQIADLTDAQIATVLFCERDESGRPFPDKWDDEDGGEGAQPLTYKEMFFWTWEKRGLEPAEIEAKWAAYERRNEKP